MKKILGILLFLILSHGSYASIHSFSGLNWQSEDTINSQFSEFGKIYSQTMNGSLGNMMNMDFVKISLGGMFMPYNKEGVLQNSGKDYVPVQYTSAGISLFNFNLFGRLVSLNSEGELIVGGGLGYQIKAHKFLTVTPFITYHQSLNFPDITKMASYAAHIQAKGNFESVNPYISAGASYNQFDTNIITDTGQFYTYTTIQPHLSFGIRVLYIYFDLSVLPKAAYGMGITIDF